MQSKRYLRFASIAGIERKDLPIAAEIWLDNISRSFWANREMIKLATHFVRYMRAPDPNELRLAVIDRKYNLDCQQVAENLRHLVAYGAAEAFDCEGEWLRASLNLSYLQRLRTLEVRRRFRDMSASGESDELPWHSSDETWLLEDGAETGNELVA